MDQCTHAIREASWKSIITACQSRPATMTVKQWLAENNVKEKAYYYQQRKLRQLAYDQAVTSPGTISQATSDEIGFAEIPCSFDEPAKENPMTAFRPDVVIQSPDVTIGLSNSASKELLSGVLKEVLHAR